MSNGTKINNSFLIFTGGVEAVKMSGLEEITKNQRGQFIVNEYMQTKEHENIFAIGDLAQIKNSKGELMPPNVTISRISGANAGKNVLNHIQNKELKKCDPKLDGILIALGGEYVAGDIKGLFTVQGKVAYEIKKYVFHSYRKPLLKLIKTGYQRLKKLQKA